MDSTQKCHTAERSIVDKENVNPLPMLKTLIGEWCRCFGSCAYPALADVYVNPEFNGGSYGSIIWVER